MKAIAYNDHKTITSGEKKDELEGVLPSYQLRDTIPELNIDNHATEYQLITKMNNQNNYSLNRLLSFHSPVQRPNSKSLLIKSQYS